MLNCQGPDKIDWTDFTWNPITGCLNDCPYCYMKRMEKRFPGITKPRYRPEYLKDLRSRKIKPGHKIFVGSSGDMWGKWMSDDAISIVLQAVNQRPDLIFQFLTKDPQRYSDFILAGMGHCWFGTTIDGTGRTLGNLPLLIDSVPNTAIKFVSFEPLIESPQISSAFYDLNWVIIGADSTRGAARPPQAWADFIVDMAREAGIPVWVKDNYGYAKRIKEFPGQLNG